MALSANTVWEVRTTGDDANGGGFVTGASGVDRSQQDAAHATLTTAATVHTTTTQINVPGGEHTVHANDIGNIFQIAGGTATAGFFQITAVDVPNNRWTLDRSAGTSTQTCSGRMGGALASLGKLGHASALGSDGDGNKVWVKSGTYTLTTTSDNVSGGPLNVTGFATGLVIDGYQTTRGDRAARPLISAGSVTGLSNGPIRGNGSRTGYVANIEYDANNGTGNTGGFHGAGFTYYLCVARNVSVAGGIAFPTATAVRCAAINCNQGFNGNGVQLCIADGCTTGFMQACSGSFNVAKGCTTGFEMSGTRQINPVAYNCTNGISYGAAAGGAAIAVNGIAYGCSNNGFRSPGGVNGLVTINCAAGNNTAGNFSNCLEEGSITLTADPFTDAANDDFSLNSAAGGGALLRAAGIRWGDGLVYDQANYLDVGALQHQDAGGGGGGLLVNPGMRGGMI